MSVIAYSMDIRGALRAVQLVFDEVDTPFISNFDSA
jgi:hypothetical protein